MNHTLKNRTQLLLYIFLGNTVLEQAIQIYGTNRSLWDSDVGLSHFGENQGVSQLRKIYEMGQRQ